MEFLHAAFTALERGDGLMADRWRNVQKTLADLSAFVKRHDFFVFFDTETTGLNPKKDRIVEISAIKVDRNFQPVATFSSYINPYPVFMNPKASEVNGITMEFLADKPSENVVIRDFAEFCEGAGLLGYNSNSFDLGMLRAAHERLGIQVELDGFDVLWMARDAMLPTKNVKLKTVAEELGVVPDSQNFHEAMFDVQMTLSVFLALGPMLKKAVQEEKERWQQCSETSFGSRGIQPKIYSISPFCKGHTQRVYIHTSVGAVFYDKIKKHYGAGTKDEPLDIQVLDMAYIEAEVANVLKKHGIDSIDHVKTSIKAY